MAKEVREVGVLPQGMREGIAALPDPGVGKTLIVVVRASSVRLRVADTSTTIQGQEPESGKGSPLPTP